MAISESALNKIIQKNASQMTQKAPSRKSVVTESYDDYYGETQDYDNYNQTDDDVDDYYGIGMTGMDSYTSPKNTQAYVVSESKAKESKLPEAIKKSMLEHQIDVPQQSSSLNPLEESAIARFAANSKHLMTETSTQKSQPRQQSTPQQQSSTVDYALIKSIVKECLAEQSTLKQINLKGGTIRLIDNSGNIYSAKLEKTGNVNDKKK